MRKNKNEDTVQNKETKKNDYDKYSFWLLALVFALIVYYILFLEKSEANMDFSDTLMWAKASFDCGKIANPDFYYACILPFGGSLLMLMFMPFFGFSYTTHALGMIVFTFIFIAALYVFFRKMKLSRILSSVSVAIMVFVLSISYYMRANFWGHIIYYSLGALFLLVGLSLLFSILNMLESGEKTKKVYITSILLCVFVFLTATNGIQALTLFIIPFIGAVLGERILNDSADLKDKESIFLYILMAGICLAMVLGLVVAKIIATGITVERTDAFSRFSDIGTWTNNLLRLFSGWYENLGVTIENNDKILSVKSVFNIIKIMFATLVAIIPVYMLVNYYKIKDRFTKILLLAHWIITFFILVAWIFGRLSTWSWRLVPIAFSSMLLFIMYLKDMWANSEKKRFTVILTVLVIFISFYSMGNIFYNVGRVKTIQQCGLDMVEEEGITVGYASLWYFNYITFMTEGKYRVGNVTVDEDGLHKYLYQCYKDSYDDVPGQDKYFLLLTTEEYETLVESEDPVLDEVTERKDSFYFVLLIFDKNIF